MKLSPEKCTAFHIIFTKDSWYMSEPLLTLNNGKCIPPAHAARKITYLGAEILPWKGLDINNIEDEFRIILTKIKRLALKPFQKATLISTYIVPHFLHRLSVAAPTMSVLRRLDQQLKIFFTYRNLQPTDFYTVVRRMEDSRYQNLNLTSLSIGYKFLCNQDPIIQTLATESGLEKHLQLLARSARINLPITLQDVTAYKREKKRELVNWASLNTQGKSVKNLTNDQIGNAWLYDPKLLKPGQFITALKMRSDTAANRVALHGARPDLNCRKCRSEKETLGLCAYTKHQSIHRHDEIKDLILDTTIKRTNSPTARWWKTQT